MILDLTTLSHTDVDWLYAVVNGDPELSGLEAAIDSGADEYELTKAERARLAAVIDAHAAHANPATFPVAIAELRRRLS